MKNPDELINHTASLLSRVAKANKAAEWDESKQPAPKPPRPLVEDRQWTVLGMPIIEHRPEKEKPFGWAILWHKWNKGITLNYRPPVPTSHTAFLKKETETTIELFKVEIKDPLTFWQRRLPKGFSFTIAKLYGKWIVTRAPCPFFDAMVKNAPLLSQEEWDHLGADTFEIKDKK